VRRERGARLKKQQGEFAMRLLHIVATPRGLASNTARVSNALLEALYERHDSLVVETLDLFNADLPAVAGSNIESKYKLMTGQGIDASALTSWQEIEQTIAEFMRADLYLLTTPMWNLSIPYVLKYYIDAIVQPGYLFRYNEAGQPEGMVKDKKMICVTSRGGDYSAQPLKSFDFVETYLRTIFGFIGLTDIHFFNVQPMDLSIEARQAAQKQAIAAVRAFVTTEDWGASDGIPTELPKGIKPAPLVEV
jgi:FMN-dependent NADH-azoreductase